MILKKFFLGAFMGFWISTYAIHGQLSIPISFNGYGNIDFFRQDQSNTGITSGFALEIKPSIFIYHKKLTDNTSIYRFAFGVRTSIYIHYKNGSTRKQEYYKFGVYPIARYYIPSRTFAEISAGPYIFSWRNLQKINGNHYYYYVPYGKILLWQAGIGIGQDLKLTDYVSVEFLLGYKIQRTGQLKISRALDLPGDDESGFTFELGLNFRLFK